MMQAQQLMSYLACQAPVVRKRMRSSKTDGSDY
jgi:hypothetical protein